MTPLYTVETYGELHPHLEEEWLVTNGLGGYSSSSLVGCNTRRYHGLLVAATLPPVGRAVLLSRLHETVLLDGAAEPRRELSVCQFANDSFHPRGERFLRSYESAEHGACWEYDVEGVRVVREVQMPWLKNAVGVRYTVECEGEREVQIELMPFVALRDFHSLRRGRAEFRESSDKGKVSVADGKLAVYLWSDQATYHAQGDWWYDHKYAIEAERGLDFTEDLYTPGKFVFRTNKSASFTVWAADHDGAAYDWDAERVRRWTAVGSHRAPQAAKAGGPPRLSAGADVSDAVRRLAHAANDFVVFRKKPNGEDGSTVIAGYPWFADWGRDTMISLPGLFLSTGRFEQAKQVLGVFAQYVSEGMIPNRFNDYTNEPEYNTVDASLWFVHACHEYARYSGDIATYEKTLAPACREVIHGYRYGTRYHIKMDEADCLITQGDADTQLTWMDAKCDGIAFTPRQGKPVEINALWYHALVLMGETGLATQVAESFRKAFWISPFRGLADVVDGQKRDMAIRPNQIFAASLANSPLSLEQRAAVVEVVRRELLTPVGLRTLARSDPNYHGHYGGPQRQRDEAYHNGTVWPWPIGAFLEAYLRVNDRSPDAVEQARRWLEPLLASMRAACVGQIGEIFEADEPHPPVGCCAQAWSVAEALRLAIELGM